MATRTFIPIHEMARRLGVSETWLKSEAQAGRLPHLRTGRRMLFPPRVVEQELAERSIANAKGGDDAGR